MKNEAPRPRLSATVICQDEAEKIRGCLESVRFCDEVVVVDSGSSDGTVEICRELADVVVETDWPGHVAQKNRALDLATGDWVLPIDADERVTPELAAEIRKLLAGRPQADGYPPARSSPSRSARNAVGWRPIGGETGQTGAPRCRSALAVARSATARSPHRPSRRRRGRPRTPPRHVRRSPRPPEP